MSLYDQWIQESSLQCGSQGVIQMTGVPYTCNIFCLWLSSIWGAFHQSGWSNIIIGIFLGMGGHIQLQVLGFIWILVRYNIEDCPGWLPVCAIWIKLDNPGFFWSHIRLSKGHQEIQMSYFGSLCDNNTLRSCAKDVLKSNHQLDSLKQNGSCTLITYITKQSVRDCKPPPCNISWNP